MVFLQCGISMSGNSLSLVDDLGLQLVCVQRKKPLITTATGLACFDCVCVEDFG